MRKTGLGDKYLSMCHNQQKSTQTEQELSPNICVERLARNRKNLVILLLSRSTGITKYSQFKFLTISKITITKIEGTVARSAFH